MPIAPAASPPASQRPVTPVARVAGADVNDAFASAIAVAIRFRGLSRPRAPERKNATTCQPDTPVALRALQLPRNTQANRDVQRAVTCGAQSSAMTRAIRSTHMVLTDCLERAGIAFSSIRRPLSSSPHGSDSYSNFSNTPQRISGSRLQDYHATNLPASPSPSLTCHRQHQMLLIIR